MPRKKRKGREQSRGGERNVVKEHARDKERKDGAYVRDRGKEKGTRSAVRGLRTREKTAKVARESLRVRSDKRDEINDRREPNGEKNKRGGARLRGVGCETRANRDRAIAGSPDNADDVRGPEYGYASIFIRMYVCARDACTMNIF